MRKLSTFLVSAATVLAFVITPATAGAAGSPDGLWAGNHQAQPTDCGIGIQANDFCYFDDIPSVELGVRFTTASAVDIVGVRVYRVDSGVVTGTLWDSTGALLATGQFGAYTGHGWQDLIFSSPVSISPGTTYTASYYAPNADYAYEYDFFKTNSFTEGPITALASVNGVYKYGASVFPTDVPGRFSNYWVTPLWVNDTTAPEITITTPADEATYLLNQQVVADYACIDAIDPSPSCVGTVDDGAYIDTASVGSKTFTVNAEDASANTSSLTHDYSVVYGFQGFFSPVDNNMLNVAKAGQAIPLKFRLVDANGAPITNLAGVTVKASSLSCALGTTPDLLEEYASGASGLQNMGDGYYQFNWKTPKSYANSCKTVSVDLGEGSGFGHTAEFKFTK